MCLGRPALNVLLACAMGGVALTLASCAATRAPPTVAEGIRASPDPRIIERGRYLAYGPAHCASCHGDPEREGEMRAGREIALSGGRVFRLGLLGAVTAPNITNDPDTGIGALSDDTLVRSLRYGISRRGKPLMPFMSSFAELSDEDLRAIVSFLRTLPPVWREVRQHQLTWIGAFGVNFMLEPYKPVEPTPSLIPTRGAEYGRYLANTVANCRGCHTRRSKLTGAFIGPDFAGGWTMKEAGGTFITPDLTPNGHGLMTVLTEEQFIARFRVSGRALTGSPMPWEAYARMTDDDLGAIYRYLKTLPPATAAR